MILKQTVPLAYSGLEPEVFAFASRTSYVPYEVRFEAVKPLNQSRLYHSALDQAPCINRLDPVSGDSAARRTCRTPPFTITLRPRCERNGLAEGVL